MPSIVVQILTYFAAALVGNVIGNFIATKLFHANKELKKEIEILKDYDVPILQFEVKELKEQMKELLECFDVKVEKKIVTIPSPLIWYGCIPEERDEIQVTKTYTLKRSAIEEGNKIVFGDDGCTLIVKGVTKVKPKTKPKKK